MKIATINPAALATANTIATAAEILKSLETVKSIAAILEVQAAEAAAREREEIEERKKNDPEYKALVQRMLHLDYACATDLVVKTEYSHYHNEVRMNIWDQYNQIVFAVDAGSERLHIKDFDFFRFSSGAAYVYKNRKDPDEGFTPAKYSRKWTGKYAAISMENDFARIAAYIERCIETVPVQYDKEKPLVYLIQKDDTVRNRGREIVRKYEEEHGYILKKEHFYPLTFDNME